jgi:DUF4097 and DUF4098 domain-containing protein YvlB
MNTPKNSILSKTKQSSSIHLLSIFLILLLLIGLSGCMINVGIVESTETVSNSFTTGSQPTIIVETFNGRINVQKGTDLQVAATVLKRGTGNSKTAAEDDLKNIEVNMTQDGDTIRIIARRINQTLADNSGAQVDLTVPEAAVLDLTTSNGRIITTNVLGDQRLSTSNGEIDVQGGQGVQNLSTSNGRIQIEAQAAQVNARTSNGQINFSGSLADGNHSFETSNGAVELSLPRDSQFAIDASTSNGRISTEFPITMSGSNDDNELRGTVGDNPGVSIRIQTSNGAVKILRSQ